MPWVEVTFEIKENQAENVSEKLENLGRIGRFLFRCQ